MNYNRNNQLTASKNELKEKTPSPNNTQTTPTSWARPGHPLAEIQEAHRRSLLQKLE